MSSVGDMGNPLDAPSHSGLRHLDPQTAERVRTAVRRLADAGQGDVTRLQGVTPPEWRLRVGGWRVRFAYAFDAQTITVCACCHGDVLTVTETPPAGFRRLRFEAGTDNFWLRRYWQVSPPDPRRRWCLPCCEWFVGRNDCPICGQALVIEAPDVS